MRAIDVVSLATVFRSSRWRRLGLALCALTAAAGSALADSGLTAGDHAIWRYGAADQPELVDYVVLAAGDDYLIQTNLKPFEFNRDDYELFVEVRGIAYFDCRDTIEESLVRTTLDNVAALFPLKSGATAGAYTVVGPAAPAMMRPKGLGPDPKAPIDVWPIVETLEDGQTVTLYWAVEFENLVGIDWSETEKDRLVEIRRQDGPSLPGVIPDECRKALPEWFWKEIGAE